MIEMKDHKGDTLNDVKDDARTRLFSGSLFGLFQTLFMAFAMIIPAMYFSSLNISIVVYAFLLSIGDVFSFAMKPVIGHLTDRHGERRYLMAGGFVFFFSLFLIGQTSDVLAITALKIAGGVASALVFVTIIIYSLRKVGQDKPDRKVGFFSGVSNLGWTFGLLIPGLFMDAFGIKPAFYLIFVVGAVWVLLMLRFAKKYESKVSVRPSFSYMKKIPAYIIYKSMDLAMFSAFLFFFVRYALQTLGLSRSVVSMIVVVEVILFAASVFLVGRISNKKLRKYWVPFCILFHLLGATAMVFATSMVHYYLVAIFIGIAGGFIDIWIYSNVSEKFEQHEKGKVIGTLGWSYDLATIFGAQIPIIFVALGLGTFTALYVFPLVMLVTYLFARRR
jgi:MFS family permease